MSRAIRNSAKAVVIKDGKLLTIKLDDNGDIFYILPGGGQEEGEQLVDTVRREIAEECGFEVTPQELLFVIEGVHGESFHRVDLVFHCIDPMEMETPSLHADINQVGFAWLDIESLNTLPLYPSKLRCPIMNFHAGKPFPRYLGNEGIGDPECTD